MKLIIAGSRTIHDYQRIIDGLNEYIVPAHGWPSQIITGGDIGIDTCAKDIALANDVKYVEYNHHKTFKDNNKHMARDGDVLLAIWDVKSLGTKHMIECMQELEKPFYIN